MGLHTRRHDSSPGPLPPLSPLSISEPPPPLLHHSRHESSPCPFPPISPPPPTPPISESQDFYHRATHQHNRRESLPGPSFPPMSPPPTTHHSRRDSYPGPFPSPISPPSSTTPPQQLFHTRRESCPIPFPFATSSPRENNRHNNNLSQLTRHESDPGLLPSTSSSSFIKHHYHHIYNNHNKLLYNKDNDLVWPFTELNGLDHNDLRETAYEVFFTACRSEPGFGGRSALTFYSKNENAGSGNGGTSPGHGQVLKTSRVKRALGLRMLGSSFSQRMMSAGGGGGGGGWLSPPYSPVVDGSPRSRAVRRRSMTMADVMRVQMRVSEHSESRLRKTLMRTLVGQVS